jgi:WD40 repeat protein
MYYGPNGATVIMLHVDGVKFYKSTDLTAPTLEFTIKLSDGAKVTCFSMTDKGMWVGSDKGHVYVLDDFEGKDVVEDIAKIKPTYTNRISSMSCYVGGQSEKYYLAAGDDKGYVYVFDINERAEKAYFKPHSSIVWQVNIFRGDYVVSVAKDNVISYGNINDGKTMHKIS